MLCKCPLYIQRCPLFREFQCARGKSGKCMNHGICAFCTKGQKWQKYESWDLHFLHQGAKMANVRIMGFALFAPRGKSGKSRDLHFLHQGAKVANV